MTMTKPASPHRPLQPGTILQSLIGAWAIERRVDDAATLTGTARFERVSEAEAAYHEQGTLRLAGGTEVAAERKYIFRQQADGLAVFFPGPPQYLFHAVALAPDRDGRLRGEAEHICGADVYLSDYQFDTDTHFKVRHRVRGPRKDYTMVTVYRKLAESSR